MITASQPPPPTRTGGGVRLLRARVRWFLGTALLVVLGAVAISWVQPRTYEATAEVVVLTEVAPGNTSTPPTPAMGTEKGLVTTDVVAGIAARRLGMPVGQVLAAAAVTVPPQTQMLSITCSTRAPALAAGCAQGLAEAYVQYKDTQPIMTTPERARVVTPATVPRAPTLPNVPLNIVAGLLVGLMAGLAVAVLWDRLDPRVRRPEELERRGLPVLGVVPAPGPGNAGAEAARTYEAFGSRLRAAFADAPGVSDGLRRAPVVVLTPIDDADVRLAAVADEIAVALAADGDRVVLVEADSSAPVAAGALRGPSLFDVLGAADVGAALDQALATAPGPGRPTILPLGGPAGTRIPRRAWARVAAHLAERFDVVLVATEPLRSSANALAIAEGASAVVTLVGVGGTTRAAVDALRDESERLGLALTGCAVVTAPVPTSTAPRGAVNEETSDEKTADEKTADEKTADEKLLDEDTDSVVAAPRDRRAEDIEPSGVGPAHTANGNGMLPVPPS